MWMSDFHWGWGWLGMGIGMILWLILIVGIVWIAVRLLARPATTPPAGPTGPGPAPSPTEVLRMRFARGEIDEEEYRRRLAVLEERPG